MRKRMSDNYKILMLLAFQEEFVGKETLDQCAEAVGEAEDKVRAVIEFLNRGHVKKAQFNRLLELYKIFLTRQDKLRFGELSVALKYLPPATVEMALEKQQEIRKKGKKPKIGELLVAAGVITARQRDLILLKQQRDFSIRLKKAGSFSSDMKEINGDHITILIQPDALKAFIKINTREGTLPDPDQVVSFMISHGVTYGLAPKEDLARFLASDATADSLFLAAQGTPMVQSKDAWVEYLFDDAFLTSGTRKEDGTGHVELDGDVVVSGIIKPGFKVKCHSLAADAIEGGHITCEGHVMVSKGVLESRIFSRGSVTAAYVNQSNITCLGDMTVGREVLDSRIVLNGSCKIETGRLLSCDVTARDGVRVMTVGSQGAKNTVITVGVSKYATEEIKRVESLVEQNQADLDLRMSDKEAVESIGTDLAAWQAKMEGLGQKLEKMISALEAQAPLTPAKKALLATHKKQLAALTSHLSENKADTQMLGKLTENVAEDLGAISRVNQIAVKEMMVLKRMINQSETVPVIRVLGKVQSGTKLCGCHSQTIVPKTISRIRAKEIQKTDESNKTTWAMVLEPA
jgi:uncharacterized protein (DUF342 family)